MPTTGFTSLIASANSLLRHPAFGQLSPPVPRRPSCVVLEPPTFVPRGGDLPNELEQLGCSHAVIEALVSVFEDSCRDLASQSNALFSSRVGQVCAIFEPGEEARCAEWQRSIALGFERQYQASARMMRHRLLDEVRSAQARHAHSPSQHQQLEQESGAFTPEVLVILHAAFQAAEHVTKAERRQLAGATGLSERQILTWFANQRQRKNKKPSAPKRAAPYSHASRPHLPLQRPPQQQHQAHHARRTVSGSSSGSSSLIEYESASHSSAASSSGDWSPTSGTYRAEGDIPVDDGVRGPSPSSYSSQSPSGAFPTLPSHFSLPIPPHLSAQRPPPAPASLHAEPAPPSGYEHQHEYAPAVPAMHLTQATPLSQAFPPFAHVAEPAYLPPAPWAPSAAGDGVEVDAQVPMEDGEGYGAHSAPSSIVGADEQALYPLEHAALAPVPAMTGALGALSDAWMDDQFYENLFGSLGLDQLAMGGVGDGGVDDGAAQGGEDGMGMEGMGPGLTLSMEEVRAEEQLGAGGAAWF